MLKLTLILTLTPTLILPYLTQTRGFDGSGFHSPGLNLSITLTLTLILTLTLYIFMVSLLFVGPNLLMPAYNSVDSMLLSPCRQDGRVKDTVGGVYEAT